MAVYKKMVLGCSVMKLLIAVLGFSKTENCQREMQEMHLCKLSTFGTWPNLDFGVTRGHLGMAQ